MQNSLNPSQFQAVSHKEGPVLVIAGAGSGKTRTLVYRVAYLIKQGINEENILLLTFTKKAASEMLYRTAKILKKETINIPGGTFHSFSNFILRKYAKAINYENNFTIFDQKDSENLCKKIADSLNIKFIADKFPNKKGIQEIISKSRNKEIPIAQVLNRDYKEYIKHKNQLQEISELYSNEKKKGNIMDYDDLVINLRDLLKHNPSIRKTLSTQYQYIMVDEYQDTNLIQAEIASLLAQEHNNIMVVGDDSQSIYSFRGAEFKNIIDFPNKFKDTKVITLETNYRSNQRILNLTNKIISKSKEKFSKNLVAHKGIGEKPLYIECSDQNEQAKIVVEKIQDLLYKGEDHREIAVLFRSGWHSNEVEMELMSQNIDFVKYGGIKFADTSHVKDLMAHFKILFNRSDSIAWTRILNLIPGVGAKTAQNIISQLINLDSLKIEKKKYSKDLLKLHTVLRKAEMAEDLGEQIRLVMDYYKHIFHQQYPDWEKREKDLDSFLKISRKYNNLESLLSDLLIEPPGEGDILKDKSKRVVLSTIHSAKGLEWANVFLIYLLDGFLPYGKSFNNPDDLEEERRLLYVAMTRAKDRLFLLKPNFQKAFYSKDDNDRVMKTRCRFIDNELIRGDYLDTHLLMPRIKIPKMKREFLNISYDFDYEEEKKDSDDIEYVRDW